MHNHITLIGNLTRNVELRITESGTQIAKFGLAVNRHLGKSDNGEPKEEVMFIDVTVFGKSAELARQYLAKGRKVLIGGRLKQDRWVGDDGVNHSRHTVIAEEIEYLDSPNKETANGDSAAPASETSGADQSANDKQSKPEKDAQ